MAALLREELAWSAGFFDGEGTTVLNCGYPKMSVGQVHREVDPGVDETTVTFRMSGPFPEQASHLADLLLAVNGEGEIDTTGVGLCLAELAQDEINRRLS